MITKNMANIRTAGTTAVRIGSTFCGRLDRRLHRPRRRVAVQKPEIIDARPAGSMRSAIDLVDARRHEIAAIALRR